MNLHSPVVWRWLNYHEKSHRKRESLFGSQKKKTSKKFIKMFEEPPHSPPKKRKTSLIYDSSTSNLVLQHRQCTTKTLVNWIGFQWLSTKKVHPERWLPPTFGTETGAGGESAALSSSVPWKWLHAYSTSFLVFFQPWKMYITTFLKENKKNNKIATQKPRKQVTKPWKLLTHFLKFKNIYKFLPKRKASVLVVSHFFKSKLLNHLRFF